MSFVSVGIRTQLAVEKKEQHKDNETREMPNNDQHRGGVFVEEDATGSMLQPMMQPMMPPMMQPMMPQMMPPMMQPMMQQPMMPQQMMQQMMQPMMPCMMPSYQMAHPQYTAEKKRKFRFIESNF